MTPEQFLDEELPLDLHKHNSIPCYFDDLDELCLNCIKNRNIQTIRDNLLKAHAEGKWCLPLGDEEVVEILCNNFKKRFGCELFKILDEYVVVSFAQAIQEAQRGK